MSATNLAALAAVAVFLITPSAHAVATAKATLSNFHYSVFDLDPTDGIAPAVVFESWAEVVSSAHDGVTEDWHAAAGAMGAALSVSSSVGLNSSFAMTTAGSPVGAGIGPGATAEALAAGDGSYSYSSGYVLNTRFTLTPHTLLVFTAAPSGVAVTVTQPGDFAHAFATVSLHDVNDEQGSFAWAEAYTLEDGSVHSYQPSSFTASFANLAAVAATGYASANVQVRVRGVGAIPEPETSAMLIAGLLVVGALARSGLLR